MGFITTVFDLLPLCTQSLANTNISCNKTSQWAHSHLFFPLSRKDDSRLVIEMKNRIYPLLPHTQDTRCSLQPPHIRHIRTRFVQDGLCQFTPCAHTRAAPCSSPACAYRGTRRETITSGYWDTAWPKIKPESVSAMLESQPQPSMFTMSPFHFANILGLACTNPRAHLHE